MHRLFLDMQLIQAQVSPLGVRWSSLSMSSAWRSTS